VQRYSGNPLALRLVAQTVHEVFDSDIRAFLEIETPSSAASARCWISR
jgi:hypothetical protein